MAVTTPLTAVPSISVAARFLQVTRTTSLLSFYRLENSSRAYINNVS